MKTKLLLCIAATCGATVALPAQPRIGISLHIGAPPPVIIHEAPPRPILVEYQAPPPTPAPNQVWIHSHHRWADGRWVRVQGAWIVPPQPDAVWVEGRWDAPTRSWTDEHWEISRPASFATVQGPTGPPYGPPSRRWWQDEHAENNRPATYVTTPPPSPPSGRAATYQGEIAQGEIYFGFAPPPLREERMSPRPSRQHTWVAGYWIGNHGRHEWVAGHWEVPPRERSTWVAPRWEQHDRNYQFVRGYWR
jgi:hypothetical protein